MPDHQPITHPVNQPNDFPAFYTLPETHSVRRRTRAANFPDYHYRPQPATTNVCTEVSTSPLLRLRQKLPNFRAATWAKLKQLYSGLGMVDETPDDVMHSVCDPKLPDAREVWDGVVGKSGDWWEQARGAM